MVKESVELNILRVTFDSKATFEKHLRIPEQLLEDLVSSLRKFWRVFHDRLLLGRCFLGLSGLFPSTVFAVWCSAADTHLN